MKKKGKMKKNKNKESYIGTTWLYIKKDKKDEKKKKQ